MTGLVFCLADSETYQLPMFSPSEIFLSPDVVNPQRLRTYRIPRGSPHINDIFDLYPELPTKPDYVFIKTDALANNFVRCISRLGCPSLISVADTHHLHRPIEKVMEYISSEEFTIISAENDRHHLKWYYRYGFRNLLWLPNLALSPRIIEPRSIHDSLHKVCFIGSLGRFHPYRRYIVKRLSANVANFDFGQSAQAEASLMYNKYLISLNISLNSDLNWRFFEVLAAGGFLLTDRLPESSGISEFLKEGTHFDAFSSYDELVSKVNYYLANPDIAKKIGINGYYEYLQRLQPKIIKKEMISILFGVPLSKSSGHGCWSQYYAFTNPGLSVRSYQAMQEIHRISIAVNVYMVSSVEEYNLIAEELRDFCRLKVINLADESGSILASESPDFADASCDVCNQVVLVCASTSTYCHERLIKIVSPRYIVTQVLPPIIAHQHILIAHSYEFSAKIDCYVRD
jgi:glycosyltransferase involved in cell wall biosynthesis